MTTADAVLRPTLFREETSQMARFYCRSDFPKIYDEHWKVSVVSHYDRKQNSWSLENGTVKSIFGEEGV